MKIAGNNTMPCLDVETETENYCHIRKCCEENDQCEQGA